MQVKDIMTRDPVCCTRDTSLREAARLMVEHDCGAIPVVEEAQGKRPVGVVTDRDITCRTVAQGKNPLDLRAEDCMSSPVATVSPETNVEDCCKLMEEKQVRRVVVVDANRACCGMVAQADIALHVPREKTAEVVKEVSQPTEAASAIR
jgi:CBS domain-containing protein